MGRGSSKISGGGSSSAGGGAAVKPTINIPGVDSTKTVDDISRPADYTRQTGQLTPSMVSAFMDLQGFERIRNTYLSEIPAGTRVMVSEPVMRSSMSNRRDPDAVHFQRGTFVGFSTGMFKRPIVELDNGRRQQIDVDMPYESIYLPNNWR